MTCRVHTTCRHRRVDVGGLTTSLGVRVSMKTIHTHMGMGLTALRQRISRGFCALGLASVLLAGVSQAQIPMQAWVHDPVISGVSISPDGKHIAAISLPDINAVPQVTVWSADDLAQPPLRFDLGDKDGGRWKPQGVSWLNNELLLTSGSQTLDASFGGRMIKTFTGNTFVYRLRSLTDPKKNRLLDPFVGFYTGQNRARSVSIQNTFPDDPNRVILRVVNADGAPDLYEFDLKSLRAKRVYRGRPGDSLDTDLDGEARLRTRFRGDGDARIEGEIRIKGTDTWQPLPPFTAKERQGIQPVGVDSDSNILFVTDNTDREFQVLREYDVRTGALSPEILFGHPKHEARDVILGRNKKKFGQLLGFVYDGLYGSTAYWIDEDRARLESALRATFKGKEVTLGSFSDDDRRAIILVSASNDPGSYYLYDASRGLTPLGARRPLLKPEELPETRFVTYKARDGLEIPAYLTVPVRGQGPFPAVVMPHGGPWARDNQRFDTWRHFLADRGYVVLQPQFRGSDGWGQTLWRAGDREWGQKMQDDKDDGGAWLVEQGYAAADRLAIYGFSYGGYAAMAAIVRPNPPWQCAIAGAGLAELRTFDKITFGSRFGRDFQNPTIAGLSPLDVIDQASIPIMVFHGDRDQTVPIEQSEKFVDALRKLGKDVQYEAIADYGHGPSLSTAQQAKVLEILETYLANGCGPGGL